MKFTKSCTIDILIGNDFNLDIIQPEKKVLQPGHHLLNSRSGWIFAGIMQTDEPLESPTNLLIVTHGTLPLSNVRENVTAGLSAD